MMGQYPYRTAEPAPKATPIDPVRCSEAEAEAQVALAKKSVEYANKAWITQAAICRSFPRSEIHNIAATLALLTVVFADANLSHWQTAARQARIEAKVDRVLRWIEAQPETQ